MPYKSINVFFERVDMGIKGSTPYCALALVWVWRFFAFFFS